MWKMSSFSVAATQLSFCETRGTKPLLSASVNNVEFLCQTIGTPSSRSIVVALHNFIRVCIGNLAIVI